MSTASNLLALFLKAVAHLCPAESSFRNNRYIVHVVDKPLWSCIALLIPVLGQVFVLWKLGVFDITALRQTRIEVLQLMLQTSQLQSANLRNTLQNLQEDIAMLPDLMPSRSPISVLWAQELLGSQEKLQRLIQNSQLITEHLQRRIEEPQPQQSTRVREWL